MLPNGYTRLTYLQSNGSQRIETNYYPQSNSKFELGVKVNLSYSSGRSIINVGLTPPIMSVFISNSKFATYSPITSTTTKTLSGSISGSKIYDVVLDYKNGIYSYAYNGEIGSSISVSSGGASITQISMHLFGEGTNGIRCNMYYLKCYDNDVLVHDYIPAKRNSDNELGLYDIVGNAFYTNQGADSFTAGDVVYEIETSVNPSNYGITTGSGVYSQGTSVTLTATPYTHKIFKNWTKNGSVVSTNTTYNISASESATYVANFEDEETYSIKASSLPSGIGSVRRSADIGYEGDSITLTAREEEGYIFSNWSNGVTSNPYTFTLTNNVNLIANYEKVAKTNSYYQYRAYVKDQLSLNSTPKANLVVTSFSLRRDLLTTANSTFTCLEIPSNINNGDVFVLYDPKGKIMYYGVITSYTDDTIKCSQIQSFYKGTWLCETHTTTSLEAEIQYILNRYANGYMKNSSYQDILQRQEKQPLAILVDSTTLSSLESKDDNKTMDFEKFIYELYEKYGIVFDFNIPYNSWTIGDTTKGSVTIRKPSQEEIKVGNNTESITNISPTTEVAQTNKLIVYAKNGTYRKTFVATTTNGIVEEPASIVGRLGQIQTKIVFSDDAIQEIVDSNISASMFNHKVEFTLVLDNKMYDFWNWELGQPIKIYNDGDYFNSVFTGYEISKSDNAEPTEVRIICGKVRTSLTKLLSIGVVND